MGILKDLLSGNFSGVIDDIQKSFAKLAPAEQAFIAKLEDDEGALMSSLCQTAIKDVAAGGFNTASFVKAGKDVLAQALTQGVTLQISEVMAELNILATALRSAADNPAVSPAPPPNPTPPADPTDHSGA